ncbi:MAG: CRISPR-associated protein Cas4 [Proteobacteria bacterium]|nr:CRISPR-associated protein Cas4 [Pseudomonadota bacterium]
MPDLDIEPIVSISSINTYLYCTRRAGLVLNELVFTHNHHTLKGKYLHKRPDLPGAHNTGDISTIRALPVWSKTLGLYGKCDIVEKHNDDVLIPIEYKKGAKKSYDNDNAQICAQALCLEEMFHINIPHGFIFHATSKSRRKVHFDHRLRKLTKDTIKAIHDLINSKEVPKAKLSPKCPGCSVKATCFPEITSNEWAHNPSSIFKPRELRTVNEGDY